MQKKLLGTILGVVELIVVVAGGTAAWFTWSSTTEQQTSVTFTVSGLTDAITTTVNESGTLTGTLTPVANKTSGVVKSFSVSKSAAFEPTVYLSFTLQLTTFPASLADPSLKWELVNVVSGSETSLGSGNFSGLTQGGQIKLLNTLGTRHTLTGTNNYKLYIWIDGTMTNDSSMQDQNYKFNLVIDATDQANAGI